jgi:cytochrome o ubiquinol oxidase operon protein cyoD
MEKSEEKTMTTDSHASSYGSYTAGFVLSIIWTLLAYFVVTNHMFNKSGIIFTIVLLAAAQLITQLVFFLHLGWGLKQRWNVMAFLFMTIILVIIVAGSLWIMQNLNYNMQMSPEDMNKYMHQQNNKGF